MTATLLLIPGLGNTERLFQHQIATFSPLMTVMVADHTRDDSMEAIARRALADAPERFALAGLSMGGYIAMEILRQAPERVERLALLDTSARPDPEEAKRNRERLIGLAEAARWDEILAELWPKLVHPRRQGDEGLKGEVGSQLRETGAAGYVRQQRAIMGRRDSRELLPGIEIPTLIVVGDGDAITPPEIAREMAEMIEWSSLIVIRGSGHLTALEEPEQVTSAMRLWLDRS
ncbi:MAG: alpha/beta hydrolase [Microvirga sp.]|jgi:pimeloyl-ACP methyl ester carboxylesterase|nr:alpha/beta hydrolase [Microvirga sp.]